jgi:hypothetical protein
MSKVLGTIVLWILNLLDFGIWNIDNAIFWAWDPKLKIKLIYVSYIPYHIA